MNSLPREQMFKLAAGYGAEQETLDTDIASLKGSLKELAELEKDLSTFIELIRKHSRIRKLTPEILNSFIDFIKVYQAVKVEGRWKQRIDIFYNCIGDLRAPNEETPTNYCETTLLTIG